MVTLKKIEKAHKALQKIVFHTPLMKNVNLSDRYASEIFLKREDLQLVRSYKLRGAYNKMFHLTTFLQSKGVVCASAGNHAQGVAYSCNLLNVKGTIFMPLTTPKQKIKQVELFGKHWVDVVLKGDTFDDAYLEAVEFATQTKQAFIHPFDDEMVIAGQGTVALEILEDSVSPIDYLFVPIGGGGLAAGMCTVFKALSPKTKIIGVEPFGASSMKNSIYNGVNTTLEKIDKFVDGAAVKRVGELTFEICKDKLDEVILVPEGLVCSTILSLYNEEAIVVEPAGALTISALNLCAPRIKGKVVVCVVSGSNNDIMRTEEIKERSLFYEGLKHYFLIQFPQRPGALRLFVTEVLGENDDITYFQFSKKNNRESGPAVVGIELKEKNDFEQICKRLENLNFNFQYLNENQALFSQLIG
ncbi:MAG: threonine ammonia-lyase IlvA [Flavobacteriia bacterium]|nr:threonine ammonia-lyase IlvA [Flavobacteriia bacterium]